MTAPGIDTEHLGGCCSKRPRRVCNCCGLFCDRSPTSAIELGRSVTTLGVVDCVMQGAFNYLSHIGVVPRAFSKLHQLLHLADFILII